MNSNFIKEFLLKSTATGKTMRLAKSLANLLENTEDNAVVVYFDRETKSDILKYLKSVLIKTEALSRVKFMYPTEFVRHVVGRDTEDHTCYNFGNGFICRRINCFIDSSVYVEYLRELLLRFSDIEKCCDLSEV